MPVYVSDLPPPRIALNPRASTDEVRAAIRRIQVRDIVIAAELADLIYQFLRAPKEEKSFIMKKIRRQTRMTFREDAAWGPLGRAVIGLVEDRVVDHVIDKSNRRREAQSGYATGSEGGRRGSRKPSASSEYSGSGRSASLFREDFNFGPSERRRPSLPFRQPRDDYERRPSRYDYESSNGYSSAGSSRYRSRSEAPTGRKSRLQMEWEASRRGDRDHEERRRRKGRDDFEVAPRRRDDEAFRRVRTGGVTKRYR